MDNVTRGRFAPSPTGRMHAGNIYAALMSWLIVKSQNGEVVLRIEDLDRERSRTEYIDAIKHDFASLGLTWDLEPFCQSERDDVYADAFEKISLTANVYECFCTRADLRLASAPHRGEKHVYSGKCRNLSDIDRKSYINAGKTPSHRLEVPDLEIEFCDLIQGEYSQNLASECGDFLIKRSDGTFAYQLAVVIDDADEGINTIVRGVDLLCSTPQQIYLQRLLNYPEPKYAHIPLLVSLDGRRLSKRDKDASLDQMLDAYKSYAGVLGHIAFVVGLIDEDIPTTPEELLTTFNLSEYTSKLKDKIQIQWVS